MLHAELKVVEGKQTGKVIPLPTKKFLIGREDDCHLRPNSELVSRHHCVFTLDDYAVLLRDLGSTNGTYVNDERLEGQVVLNAGDRIRIGKLEFELQIGQPAAVADGAPAGDAASEPPPEAPAEPPAPELAEAGSETVFEMQQPTQEEVDEAASTTAVYNGDTTVIPPQQNPYQTPMPGYPQPQPGYPPQQYPGYPPPAAQYPYPMYPQQPAMPGYGGFPGQPAYPQQMMPQQPAPQAPPPAAEQPAAPAPAADDVPDVKLPDPSETGAKAPEPKKAPSADGATPKQDEDNPSGHAADIIRNMLHRRPGGE